MHILGYVRQLRELAERTNHRFGSLVAQLVEQPVQFLPRLRILVAAKPNRGLPDIFRQIESRFALLLTQGVAQHASEQANVLPQRVILRLLVIDVIRISIHTFALGSDRSHKQPLLWKMRTHALSTSVQYFSPALMSAMVK